MSNTQIDALNQQLEATRNMRDAAQQSWAREVLVEFCQTANIDPKLVENEESSAGLEIPLNDQGTLKVTLYVSGYNYPDVGVSIGLEPATFGGSVFTEAGIPAGLAELARQLTNEAEYTRNKAVEQERVVARVNAFIAKLPATAVPPVDTEDDGA